MASDTAGRWRNQPERLTQNSVHMKTEPQCTVAPDSALWSFVKLRRIHIFHSAAVVGVADLLGFAAALVGDALMVNQAYDAVAARRVEVTAQTTGCFYGRRGANVCDVTYSFAGHDFTAVIPATWPKQFYVDSLNTRYRKNASTFARGPAEITGDIVVAVLLFLGALVVAVAHQLHLRRRRRAGRHRAGTRASRTHGAHDGASRYK